MMAEEREEEVNRGESRRRKERGDQQQTNELAAPAGKHLIQWSVLRGVQALFLAQGFGQANPDKYRIQYRQRAGKIEWRGGAEVLTEHPTQHRTANEAQSKGCADKTHRLGTFLRRR